MPDILNGIKTSNIRASNYLWKTTGHTCFQRKLKHLKLKTASR